MQTVVLSVHSASYDCGWLNMHAHTSCPWKIGQYEPWASKAMSGHCTKLFLLQLCFVRFQKPVRLRHQARCPTVDIQHCHLVHEQSGCTTLCCGVASHLQCMHYRVCEGIEAPEMAQQQRNAGFYYPHPKHDMWGFGLLLFYLLKGRLPQEHQIALRDGTTLLFASKLCVQGRYTEWRHKVTSVTTPDSMNECLTY